MSLARAQEGGGTPSFRNPDLPAEARAADLAGRLTLAEKVSQMQNASPAIERLGIPAYEWWNEALHGVARAGRATVFPQAIGLAATWDTSLMFQVADTISTEARAKYNLAQRSGGRGRYHGLTFWSPNVNIFRDPRWGRGQETYGEDPFLTSRMAVAFIQGMQGGAQGGVKNNDSRYWKTVATPKHFAVHSGPEPLRHSFDVHPSATDLNDTYLPAFEASVVEGEAASVMCSYNRIDGVPACANSFLLQERLRDTWGFQGYVVSDCGAITDIVEGHQYKANLAGAAASAVKAGTDLTCGDEYAALPEAVKSGLISEGVIDAALRRLFVARIRLGMFDPAERVPYASIGEAENDSPAHRQAALQAARESIVLLKNAALSNRTHILPLKSVRKIAVIGPAADDPDALLANYHGTPSSTVTPLAGMRRQFGGATEIRYALGSTFSTVSPTLVPADSLIVPPHAGTARQPGDDAHGLLAQYFANPDFRGEPAMSRREDQVYLQRERGDSELESRLPPNGYSVRWSGSLTAPYSGEYDLGIVRLRCEDCAGDDEARLFLDDRLVLEDARPSSASRVVKTTKLSFRRGRKYRVRVEYRQRSGGVGLQLIWIPPAQPLLDEARDAIKRSEVTVAFVGLNAELEGEEMPVRIPGFSGGDRTTLDLPQPQEQLLEAARRTGKPLVVVLLTGSAVAMNFAQENSSAVLEAWYGGEEAGTAIAETLAGKNNPAGRLPITFYQSVNDLPAFDDYAMRGRTYRYFAGRTLYPFGAGLSYSAFRYSGLRIAPTSGSEERIHVSADVQNTSALAGDEVVQLYVAGEGGTEDDPIRELRGFQRVHLAPGESRLIEFDLDRAALRRHARGKLRISVGGGQPLGDTPHVEALF
jgi:beta-glucosidase